MNPYTDLVIEGRKINLLFGLSAIMHISKENEAVEEKDDLLRMVSLYKNVIFYGHVCYCDSERVKPELKFSTVYNYVDRCLTEKNTDEIKRVVAVWIECAGLNEKPSEEKVQKKNLIGKKSKSSASGKS
jgi:hypothetical protein